MSAGKLFFFFSCYISPPKAEIWLFYINQKKRRKTGRNRFRFRSSSPPPRSKLRGLVLILPLPSVNKNKTIVYMKVIMFFNIFQKFTTIYFDFSNYLSKYENIKYAYRLAYIVFKYKLRLRETKRFFKINPHISIMCFEILPK